MGNILKKREIVSFDGPCPYNCKHCYTFGLNEENKHLTIEDIVNSLKGKEFDVIYVSHNKENFLKPSEGIKLCEELFSNYNKDIIAITRNVFNDSELNELVNLQKKMKEKDKDLFLAVSIPAKESINITEGNDLIPTPSKRIDFLKRAKEKGLTTILVIRPLFPNNIIPTSEALEIIDDLNGYVDCVLSSGLAVNKAILSQLKMSEEQFKYLDGDNSNYLIGATSSDTKYIDVTEELSKIKAKCSDLNIPFFDHSLSAINYLKQNK